MVVDRLNTASAGYFLVLSSLFAELWVGTLNNNKITFRELHLVNVIQYFFYFGAGIPCRSVTNYVSAHDTNRTFTVDKYFDRDGNEVPNGPDEDCYDSCWNFHVWNDVWMQRPDLPQGKVFN